MTDAFKLPKDTPEGKATRREAIQKAMIGAADVPLDVARRCARILDLASLVVEMGNPNTLSDAGCGARFVHAALHGALFNVRINLGSIKDEAYVTKVTAEVNQLAARAETSLARVLTVVDAGL